MAVILSFIRLTIVSLMGCEIYAEWKRERVKEKFYLACAFLALAIWELLTVFLFSQGFLPAISVVWETFCIILLGYAFLYPLIKDKQKSKKVLLINVSLLLIFFVFMQISWSFNFSRGYYWGSFFLRFYQLILLSGIIYALNRSGGGRYMQPLSTIELTRKRLLIVAFSILLFACLSPTSIKGFFLLIFYLSLVLEKNIERKEKFAKEQGFTQMLLEERERTFSLLQKVGSATTSTLNLDKVLSLVVNSALESTKAEAGAVFLLDKKKEELNVKYIKGFFPPLRPVVGYSLIKKEFLERRLRANPLKVGETIIGMVAQEGKGLLIKDALNDRRVEQTIPDIFKIKTMLIIPLKVEKEIFGVISMVNKKQEELFNEDDYNLLDTLANQMVVTINNASVYERMQRDYFNTIRALSRALEAKDKYTQGHADRVVQRSMKIGRVLGVGKEELKQIEYGAALHDIGKMGIGELILGKKSSLLKEEYDVIKEHPVVGEKIVESLDFLGIAKDCIRHHHERYEGGGYPDGIRGKDIPLGARIIAVADTFDAMTSDRPYRKSLSVGKAIEELKKVSGQQLDPQVVEAFLSIFKESGAG